MIPGSVDSADADSAEADAADVGVNAPTTAPTTAPTPVRARWRRDPVALVAAAIVLVPSLVAAVSALRNPWIPTNDWALIELRVREVGTGDTPLVGPWSRFGWRHPGPLMFYVLALPYRLVPADHGLLFATSCVNLAATVGFALVVLRYSRSRAVIALLGLAVLQWGMGVDLLSDPWNPTILLVPFALYLVLCLEIACGRQLWPVPVAAGVASFVVQSHVGLAQPVLLVGVVAFAMRWWFVRREDRDDRDDGGSRPDARRRLGPTALVLGVAWLPAVIDQVNGSGNLGRLIRWARGEEVGQGMGELTEGGLSADRILEGAAWLLNPFGLWVGRYEPIEVFGSLLLGQGRPVTLLWVPFVLALALFAVRRGPMASAYRRPSGVAGILAATAVLALLTDLVTAEGAPVYWAFRWAAVVVMLVFVTVGWVITGLAVARFPWLDEARPGSGARSAPARLAGVGMVALVALPVALAVWWGSVGRQPVQPASEALLRLRPTIEEYVRQEPVVVANSTDFLNDKDLGLPVLLARAGIDWVEFMDPRAEGHHRYMIVPAGALENPQIAVAIHRGWLEVLAGSGPPGDSELFLIRSEAEDPPSGP